jgi:hypothetical protein
MKHLFALICFAVLLALCAQSVFAQSDLQVFGFYQAKVARQTGVMSLILDMPTPMGIVPVPVVDGVDNFTSPSLQQLNFFFRKEISPSLTSWVNLEVVNSFNTSKDWGEFSVEEAWVNYQYSDAFNFKGGLLVPRFNYLNEIKNKMPVLPYVVRPLVYEPSLAASINPGEYLPERAFFQFSGYAPVGGVTLEYSAFLGHSESNYILSGATRGARPSGSDTTSFKAVGGRIGVKSGDLRLGVSGSNDKANRQATLGEDVNRIRLGADLGYSISRFFCEGEYINVHLAPGNTSQNLDKLFYYGLVGVNLTDEIYAYGCYSYLKDLETTELSFGMKGYNLGAGYRPTDALVLKCEYAQFASDGTFSQAVAPGVDADAHFHLKMEGVSLAVSVLF